MTFTINKRILLVLSLSFIIATIAGTISHEFGHYLAARIMGFDAHISYAMTQVTDADTMSADQRFWKTLAGPLLTVIIGTVSFLLFRHSKPKEDLNVKEWVLVFLSLFWLRPVFNFIMLVVKYFAAGKLPGNADEIKLARHLQINDWMIISLAALAGIIISLHIIFKTIPVSVRFTFILAGLIGGAAGYFLWLVWLGPILMP